MASGKSSTDFLLTEALGAMSLDIPPSQSLHSATRITDAGKDVRDDADDFVLTDLSDLESTFGPDDDMALSEVTDWIQWENVDRESFTHQNELVELQSTLSVRSSFSTISDYDFAALENPTFSDTSGKIDVAVSAADLQSLETRLPALNPDLDDIHLLGILGSVSQLKPCSRAAGESPEHNLTLPMSNRYAKEEDWETHRTILTRLYRDERRSLKDVKASMEDVHGFRATDKMYKRRIHDWQLFKNHKASEKEEIIQHLEAHRRLGVNLGQPMIRGLEVNERKIKRYVKDKRKATFSFASRISDHNELTGRSLTTSKDNRPGRRARVQRAMSCSAISFVNIRDPTEYRSIEDLLLQIDQYFNSKLQNDPYSAWLVWRKSAKLPGRAAEVEYTYRHNTYTRTFNQFGNLYQQYASAAACLTNGRSQAGWKMMNEAADMVRPCLLKENPSFLTIFLGILVDPGLSLHPEILDILLHLVSSMAIIVYGDRHPISVVCCALQAFREKKNVVFLAQRKLLDTLNHHLGDDHAESMYLQTVLSRTLETQKTRDESRRAARESVTLCEITRGRDDFMTRSALYELATLCHGACDYSEAWEMCLDILERGGDQGETDRINIRAHTMLGLISKHRKDYDTAERFLWIGLSSSLLAYGPSDPMTVEVYNHYQLMVAGRQASQMACRGAAQFPQVPHEDVERLARLFPHRSASLSNELQLS